MRRKARRVTQADFRAQGRAFVADVVSGIAQMERQAKRQAMIGTFKVKGNKADGYWIEDTDTFNNWKTRNETGENFKTREAAEDYARRCHDFKIGRRMKV